MQASAKILMYSPNADKFYNNIKERLEARYKPPNDPKTVKYLMDMGFTENKVIKALRLRKSVILNVKIFKFLVVENGAIPLCIMNFSILIPFKFQNEHSRCSRVVNRTPR